MDATISVNTALGQYLPDELCLSPNGVDSSEEKKAEHDDYDNPHNDDEEEARKVMDNQYPAALISVAFPVHAGNESLLGLVLEANAFFKGLEQWILKAVHAESPLADCSDLAPGDALVSFNGSTNMEEQLDQLAAWNAHALSGEADDDTENAVQIVQMVFYKRSEVIPESNEQHTLVHWWIHPEVVVTLQTQQQRVLDTSEHYDDEYNHHDDADHHDHHGSSSEDTLFGLYAYSNAHGYLTIHRTAGFWKDWTLIHAGDTLCQFQGRSTHQWTMRFMAQWMQQQHHDDEALSFQLLLTSESGRRFVQEVRENQMYLQEARRQARKRKKVLGCFFAVIVSVALAIFIVTAVRYNQSHSQDDSEEEDEANNTSTTDPLRLR